MPRIAVLVYARDRPGLLRDVSSAIASLGLNIVFSVSIKHDLEAHMFFMVEGDVNKQELMNSIKQVKDVDEVNILEAGIEAAEALIEFVKARPSIIVELAKFLEPNDVAHIMFRLSEEERRPLYHLLPREVLARILVVAGSELVEEAYEVLGPKTFSNIVSILDLDEAADVLRKLPPIYARSVLESLSDDLKRSITNLLKYHPETAGGLMTTRVPVARKDDTIAEVLFRLRVEKYDVRDTIVVVDDEGRVVGLVPIDALLREKVERKIGEVVRRPPVVVHPNTSAEKVARLMLHYNVSRLIVVDEHQRFLGLVTIDDVAHYLAKALTEDMVILKGAEVPRESYLAASIAELFKRRITWLLSIYLLETITATILKHYEELISRIAVLAAFIPLIMDTGGNAGSQAAATIIRALALGEVSERSKHDIVYVFVKEVATAALLGLSMGAIGFLFSYALSLNFGLAVAVASSLFTVIVFAVVTGALLPILARRMGTDPAVVSSPLLTTIVDLLGVLLYVTLVSILTGS